MGEIHEISAGELMSIAGGYWKPCALHAAVKLEIFTILDDGELSSSEVATHISGNQRGVSPLLDALVAMELLVKNNNFYANTSSSKTYLSKKSSQYIGYIIMHHHHLIDGWAQLDFSVKSGKPAKTRSHGEEKERESFQMGMFNIAMGIAPQVADQIDLTDRHHLLDLGGGPGTHAIHSCLANPKLKATIFDLPTTHDFAMNTVKKFNLEDRIDFVAGDFNTDAIAGLYDVAWLSQILHSNGPEQCQRIIAKTVETMEPGGLIMIHEFFLYEDKTGPLFPALFSLNMLINNEGGRSYSETEITEMLMKAGAKDIHRLPFQGPNDSYVLCGAV